MLVRETMPAYQITATAANGTRTRWAADEQDAANVPSGLSWATSMPGGADTLRCTLPRDPERGYEDLGVLSTLSVSRDGGRAMTFRLDEAPKVSGDQMAVEPAARGFRALLEDRSDVKALFVDRDLSRWGEPSRAWKIDYYTNTYSIYSPSVLSDNTDGEPSVQLGWEQHENGRTPVSVATYDSGGPAIGSIYYKLTNTVGVTSGFVAFVAISSSATTIGSGATSDLITAIPTSVTGTYTATVANARWGWLYIRGPGTTGWTDFGPAKIDWRNLAVYGARAITATTPDSGGPPGYYTGRMLASLIASDTALSPGTIEDGTFVHRHAAYLDPGTALSIVENLARYEPLYDWYCWTDEFNFQRRGTYGKRWKARVSEANLRATGQTVDRVYNEIVIRVSDPLYGECLVGPTDAGYSFESSRLRDSDPDNPANLAGTTRRAMIDIGTGTTDGAVEVGARWLQEAKAMDTAGQCELVGYVEDDTGVQWPVDAVRAGDEISFTDSADTSWRRISATSFSADTQTNALSIDSPASTMDGLLARLGASIISLG